MVKTNNKLAEVLGHMQIPQALYLELLHILIDEGILSEDKAIVRYEETKKKYSKWK